jgi:hypothetical protein
MKQGGHQGHTEHKADTHEGDKSETRTQGIQGRRESESEREERLDLEYKGDKSETRDTREERERASERREIGARAPRETRI